MQKFNFPETPLLIAHRGYKHAYPENTLPAFEAAWKAGVRMQELDILWSRDEKLMVFHDARLERCTDGRGFFQEKDSACLRLLDAGSWFSPEFKGAKIPFLHEVVEKTPENCWLNIEVKPEALMGGFLWHKMAKALLRISKELKGRLIISSFHHGFLIYLAGFKKPPLTGILTSPYKNHSPKFLPWLYKKTSAFSWHPCYENLNKKDIAQAKAFGLKVFPYTVNDKQKAEKALLMGVDGFFSDKIDTMDTLKIRGF